MKAGRLILVWKGRKLSEAAEVTLTLEDERGEYFAGQHQYKLAVLIRNKEAQPARESRLIVTLEYADGAIDGYRAVDLAGDLSAGETRKIDLTISPIRGQAPARHRLALEAQRERQP